VPELVAYHRAQLQQLIAAPVDPNQDLETWETRETLVKEWQQQLPDLRPRIADADRRYQQLLDKLRGSSQP
jgi:hypothetical protein